ncbi:hypothetical protein JMF89_00990 [Clostridiaceae bacterium UIB06]|uniref:DUF1016 family protein n=2 Tax=Clostridium thailandense TaxID=2794346 RepID=A0A949TLW1_9CLOT|nr:hypothetical protein [Clostridium thailandense]MCH5135790.1 hypothetical protein [Clostridiaceae bacterium UIB06]
MTEGEEGPIALILCAEKNSEEVELLELGSSGIHVAEYMTQLPPKEVLQGELHDAADNKTAYREGTLLYSSFQRR